MEPIIKVDNVSMCFNLSTEKHESLKEYLLAMVQGRLQYDEFYALKDVSLDIMPGDFYGLVGLNGSGKSTLLKTIAGVYKPTRGKVTVNGTIAPLIELGAGFDMDLTARENIYLNGTVLGLLAQVSGREVRRDRGVQRAAELSGCAAEELLLRHGGPHRLCHCHHHQARYPHRGRGALGGRLSCSSRNAKSG